MKTSPSPASARPPGPPAWRRRLPLLAALALAALLVAGLWPRPVPVEAEAVSRGPLVVTVDEEGMTRLRQRHVVAAPVSGHLRRIDWKPGAEVVAGRTVLAVMESGGADLLDARGLAQAGARVRAAAAARDAAAAQARRAAAAARTHAGERERARQLRARGANSVQELDLAELRAEAAEQEARAAESGVQVAEFELQQAEAVLARGQAPASEPLVITAPVSGRILRVFQESSRLVPAGFPLLEIGDPSDLEVRIEVLSRDGVAIAPGARVQLDRWGGPEPLAARVRLVEPAAFTKVSALGVEEQRVYVIADFTEPAARRAALGDGYRVEARIVVWERPDVLRAPAGALFQRAGGWQAFVVAGGRAELRSVRVGRGNGVQVEVLEGLREGDQVVMYPGDKVEAGARVAPLPAAGR